MMRIKHSFKIFVPILAIIIGFLSVNTSFANTVRRVLWNKNFIQLQVPIGKEKIIEFCGKGSISSCKTIGFQPSIPTALLESGELQYIGANGAIYLSATKAFSNKLVEVRLHNAAGDTVFFRLSASKQANDDRIEVLLSGEPHQASVKPGQLAEDTSLGGMIRWVSQQLYAPTRLMTHPNWIHRVPMHTMHFVPLYRSGVVSCMPLASWQAGSYYITAVLARNVLNNQTLQLSHTMLQGSWIASAFFRLSPLSPSVLTPAQSDTDSSTIILVSTVPFVQALNGESNDV